MGIVIESVRALVEFVQIVGAGRIRRLRNGDALRVVLSRSLNHKLADHPAIGQLIVENNRVAIIVSEAFRVRCHRPETVNRSRRHQRGASLVVNGDR